MVLVSTSVPSLMILAEAAKESPRQHFGIAPREFYQDPSRPGSKDLSTRRLMGGDNLLSRIRL